jgi:hypothetical protein
MQNDTASPTPETPARPLATVLTILAGAFAVVLRFVPHPANFSSIGTMGLFGGARLVGWRAYLLPLGLMVLSDCGLWALTGDFMFSPLHISRTYVYGSFMLYVVIGRWLQDTDSVWRISAASLLGSLQFYLLTNFGNWLLQPLDTSMPDVFRYSRDLSGLLTCMAAGLPFYQGDNPVDVFGVILGHDFRFGFVGLVLGDLVFANAIFVLHGALARKLSPALTPDVRPIEA